MAEDKRMWLLVNIEPVILDMGGSIVTYTSKDYNKHAYTVWSRVIAKHNFQIGDDMKVCLWNAINGVVPVRPEQTEEQKNVKPRGMFGI